MHVHNLCKLKLKRKLLQSPAETFITLFSLTDSLSKVLSSDRGLSLKPRTGTAVSSSLRTLVYENTLKSPILKPKQYIFG